ncbi:hypothetical protein KC19_8G174800 [Ceratodon purpureus]|uniref:Anaphase-promoting complex subunit 4 n=1 Tax=Ceratodon purpureus TaxID=3225 RepID=A0A8T0H234_CERPU|nr:hypothetical protein KC19_8G174800 [Ceratodon purpureus]KAG0565223.1 hypothetical protein KC19_8G174800 [Ceratodon purpureus]
MGDVEEEAAGDSLAFTLHLDKPLSSQVDKASWNPDKDLLAMATRDHQLIVHRFNWQRLWAITPEMQVTSLCWRPDGKALAVGHDDGSIAIHDVENGDVLRQIATHDTAVECLYWAQEGQEAADHGDDVFCYEDRTSRFFPSPPHTPPMPGMASNFDMSGVLGHVAEDQSQANRKNVLRAAQQRLYILCSGDRNGIICLSAFGVFPIGKLDIRDLTISGMVAEYKSVAKPVSRLLDASALEVSLSEDLRNMTVICSGAQSVESLQAMAGAESRASGLYAISVDTSLLGDRRKELRQVALQASSVEELLEVVEGTVTVMRKHWSEAISTFEDKFRSLSTLLLEHGSPVKPRDEFLSLLACGSASAALHQFLAASLGEAGLKRLAKSIDTAGRELHNLIAEHLQPAAEIIAFRVGELRGLSRWRSRLRRIGLHETLMEDAMENAGMLLVQVERLLRTVSDTTGQFRLFFVWLTKSLRQLNGDVGPQANQLPAIDSVGVADFLRTHFERDPVGPHLAPASDGLVVDIKPEEEARIVELAIMGGFADTKFLSRTLSSQIERLRASCQEAFAMPVKEISPNLQARCMLLLCPLSSSLPPISTVPLSLTYFEVNSGSVKEESRLEDYICLRVQDDASAADQNVVVIVRDFSVSDYSLPGGAKVPEVLALRLEKSLHCIDLALYKQRQVILLVSEKDLEDDEKTIQTYLMLLQLEDLEFTPLSPTSSPMSRLPLLHLCSTLVSLRFKENLMQQCGCRYISFLIYLLLPPAFSVHVYDHETSLLCILVFFAS